MRKLASLLVLGLLIIFAMYKPIFAQGLQGCDQNSETDCAVIQGCEGITDSTLCGSNQRQTIDENKIFGPNGILTKAAKIISIIVGVASVIMIIIGSFQYVIASGDSTNIQNAKNTILYAVIGLVVTLLARGIISFVLVKL